MPEAPAPEILIGPRTTVFTLIEAYPFLEPYLLAGKRGFGPRADRRATTRWARVTTLSDVALTMNTTWRQLAREIAVEFERGTGRQARVVDVAREIADDDRRLGELRAIVAGLEDGAPLPEMAKRWQAVTADLEAAETVALEKALVDAERAARDDMDRHVRASSESADGAVLASLPEGHPLDTLEREAAFIRLLCTDVRGVLDRLGGSPTRRRWRLERQLVSRLVDRLAGVELRFRRQQQAWFPALGVHGVSGPQSLLGERQAGALEMLRRLRLAVDGDDAASVAEGGARLVDSLEDLLVQDERLLEPPAEQYFSDGDWAAVRELEDGVGWSLIPPPPKWPSD